VRSFKLALDVTYGPGLAGYWQGCPV